MGNTCIPVADSCWYMAKPIQYCKVKKQKKKKRISTKNLEKKKTKETKKKNYMIITTGNAYIFMLRIKGYKFL